MTDVRKSPGKSAENEGTHPSSLLASHFLRLFRNVGVHHYVICPGGRNAPFVELLEELGKRKACSVWTHFEERSSAFFALGLARRFQERVAVITTSGTAAAELLPAAIESHYQDLPLVFVTADRPRRYRHFGTPQTIDQVNLFGRYVRACFDCDAKDFHPEHLAREFTIEPHRSLHFNICFDDPLSAPIENVKKMADRVLTNESSVNEFLEGPFADGQALQNQSWAKVSPFHHRAKLPALNSPAFLISGLTEGERKTWAPILQKISCPQFFESTSGLTNPFAVSEQTLITHLRRGSVKSLVRIGTTPTCRLWRDLEDHYADVSICSLTTNSYPGLARSSHTVCYLNGDLPDELRASLEACRNNLLDQVLETEQCLQKKLTSLYKKFPQAEQTFFHGISQAVAEDPVYLGNSLPIRRYDRFRDPQIIAKAGTQDVFANRGANGIDGQLSTYFGWSVGQANSWCVLGDLTLMYDMAAFWSLRSLDPQNKKTLIVINNHGGKIFQSMFASPVFMNEHAFEFSKLAAFWNADYHRVETLPELSARPKDSAFLFVEIIPDEKQTHQFQSELVQISTKLT